MSPEHSTAHATASLDPNSSTNGITNPQQATPKETSKKGKEKPPQLASAAPAANGESEKLSGAALKAAKKAEKAAKRAQAKDGGVPQWGPGLSDPGNEVANEAVRPPKGGSAGGMSAQKAQQHKRGESTSKPSPHRLAHPTADKPPPKPKEDKRVALFGHLYDKPRRTTLAAAGKEVHPAVLALGLKIASYAICGSTARCVAMLLAFKQVIESYSTPAGTSLPRHLTTHLGYQIDHLRFCRPLAISMGNAIRWLKLEINNVDPDTEEDRAKADLCEGIDSFIRERITAASQVIANSAQEKIQDGDVILTFAKSNIVQQTLVQALRNGRKFSVIVVDSRPLHEGKNTAKSLADIGVDVTYSTTHAISYLVDRATKVLLGAHSMLGNGRMYSRAGSALVAMMARAADLPVIVCCESVKFTDRVALDSIVTNEVAPPDELLIQGDNTTALSKWKDSQNLQLLNLMYDVTPAEYINMVVTEYGSLPPSSVPVVHRLSTNT